MLLDRDLEYFITIAAHASLAKAAVFLEVSQPTLSRAVQKLEKNLGTSLLERTATGVILTPAGKSLLRRAQVAFAALQDASREIREAEEGIRGHVRIAVGASVWPLVSKALAPRLQEERPLATIEINVVLVDQIVDVLAAGLYDFGICVIPKELSVELDAAELFKDRMVPLVRFGHPLTIGQPQSSQLLEYPWVGLPSRLGTQSAVVSVFNALGLRGPEYAVRTDTLEIALDMVARTNLVAFAPERLAHDYGTGRRLAAINIPNVSYSRTIGVLTRRNGHVGSISLRALQLVKETAGHV